MHPKQKLMVEKIGNNCTSIALYIDRLVRIADTLGRLYHAKAKHEIGASDLVTDMSALEVKLTPADGWEGKNVEARKTARAVALSADAMYEEHTIWKHDLERHLALIDAKIAGKEAERRAIEKAITGMIATLSASETVLTIFSRMVG